MTDELTARAAAQRLAALNTAGAAQHAFNGYPEADLRDPKEPNISDVEQKELLLGDAPRRGKTRDAIRDGGR